MASLLKNNPELAKEWHPTKNGSLEPTDLTLGSNKKVWWVCAKGMNGRPGSTIETTAGLGVRTVQGVESVLITAYTLLTQLLPVNGILRKTVP